MKNTWNAYSGVEARHSDGGLPTSTTAAWFTVPGSCVSTDEHGWFCSSMGNKTTCKEPVCPEGECISTATSKDPIHRHSLKCQKPPERKVSYFAEESIVVRQPPQEIIAASK
jgi:hypothetical protein